MSADYFDVHIRLTPRAAAGRIGEMREGAGGIRQLAAYVTAPPDKNQANEALTVLLAEHFDVPKSSVTILRGHAGRNKRVRITRR